MSKQMNWRWGAILLAAGMLGGCVESQVRISPDYGVAVNENIKAQIADPDAHYTGTPQPASNGVRTAAAQRRYVNGTVIAPASGGTSSSSSGGGGGGGGTAAQ